MVTIGVAKADVGTVSRTSDYTLTWSGPNFTAASAFCAASHAYSASAFNDASYAIQFPPNSRDFGYDQGGGVTLSTPTPISPNPALRDAQFSGDGSEGYWGWHYNTAAGPSGSALPISYDQLGNLATLKVKVGGSEGAAFDPPISYYVFVYLPGDWTTEGTSTGNHTNVSVNPSFSPPTFTYDAGTNTTTVETFAYSTFTTGGPNLQFTLIGGVVPDPRPG